MHGGLLARLGLLLHCWGVLAWMARAWTQVLSSSRRVSFTSRWRCKSERPSNWGLTTRTLKWDSEPAGTACMWLSFMTSRCSGLRAWASLVCIVVSTGPMWGWWWVSCLVKARVQVEGRRQRRALDSIRHRREQLQENIKDQRETSVKERFNEVVIWHPKNNVFLRTYSVIYWIIHMTCKPIIKRYIWKIYSCFIFCISSHLLKT